MTAQLSRNRAAVTAALMLGMFLAAIEATIVATAMPSIVSSLGGFSLYSWVFSAFLLAQGALIPVYGKLADLYGRRPVYIAGILIFLLGALLCAQARTMPQLIVFRAVQGLGAAAIQPITMTIIGDLYTLQERARVQGLLASVWGVSSVLGPAAGGFIVQFLSWPWIFYLNLPLGLLSILGVSLFLREDVERRPHSLDIAGSFYLTLAITVLIVNMIESGTSWPLLSPLSLGLLLAVLLLSLLFVRQERRAPEPVLPLSLFRQRVILVADLAVLIAGALTLAISYTIPTFAQGVLGVSPAAAGAALAAMSLGWPLTSTVSGYLLLAWGYRRTALLGSFLMAIAAVMLLSLGPASPLLLAAGSAFLMGAGLGFTSTTYIISIQEAVGWQERGVATGSNALMRMLGSTAGVAWFGSLLNRNLLDRLAALPAGVVSDALGRTERLNMINLLLDPAQRQALPPNLLQNLTGALAGAMHTVFWAVVAVALVGFVVVLWMPAGRHAESR